MIYIWASLMAKLDKEYVVGVGDDERDDDDGTSGLSPEMIEVGKFMADFFRNIPKERYCFFVGDNESSTTKQQSETCNLPSQSEGQHQRLLHCGRNI